MIIGPGFPAPPDGATIPPVCDKGAHRFEECGVCTTCRRTVAELAALGLADPVHCSVSGIHVLVGEVCIECEATVKVRA
ncbi:hypothetical protein LCGC14_0724220 [marine sediment metagenome]|uniref:Uncharacterized protein n=1 Tax=marine sediment metagenome TaxID=412755 RepID=A0A0F9QBH8_9ZZZZ